jgi:DNA-3-methyladenine glycosylase II
MIKAYKSIVLVAQYSRSQHNIRRQHLRIRKSSSMLVFKEYQTRHTGEQLLVRIKSKGPFNLALSLKVTSSFSQENSGTRILKEPINIDGRPAILTAMQVKPKSPAILILCTAGAKDSVKRLSEWMLATDLDLRPFYKVAAKNPKLKAITKELYGLKAPRPASLFEMMVIAITEQQISLSAAYRIRDRVVKRFGRKVDDLFVFPTAERLSRASESELVLCGLSHRKAEYIRDLAREIADGKLDLDEFRSLPDDEVEKRIMSIRGFGPWSANYVLVRGLGRVDRVPVDDLAIRTVIGEYLGSGKRVSAEKVAELVSRFAPYRGLAAFYFLAHSRMHKIFGKSALRKSEIVTATTPAASKHAL